MMMLPDKKKIASLIVNKIKPKMDGGMEVDEQEYQQDESINDNDMALEAAMESFIAAYKREDAAAMAQIFKDAFQLMEQSEEEL